jgi:hypothetical protein
MFSKEWPEEGTRTGGLFGAGRAQDQSVLPWNRAMQAAFLIYAGRAVCKAVTASKAKWAVHLRPIDALNGPDTGPDPAFYGRFSLLATDQGIRGLLQVINDLCYVTADDLGLHDWTWEGLFMRRKGREAPATDEIAATLALDSLEGTRIGGFLTSVGQALSSYDWRTSSTPDLPEDVRLHQAVFRGSSGYKEMRRQLILHLTHASGTVATAARKVKNLVVDQ